MSSFKFPNNITLYNTTVTEFMVNVEYILTAQLLEEGFVLYEDEVRFTITGLPETMSMNILLSNTSDYKYPTDVFLLGERIYIGYNLSVENATVTGLLVYPNNYTMEINLPFNFKANQTGAYTLSVTAEKPGYRTINQVEYFAVIEHEPFSEKKKEEAFNTWIILSIIVVILLIIIGVYRHKKK